MERERGTTIDLSVLFNDRRTGDRTSPSAAVPLPQMAAALAATRFDWPVARDDPHEPLMVNIEDAADAVLVRIVFDTHHLAPALAESWARAMQTIAVAAAV
ncbi:hypothetical protein [Dactylosporangium sp. NPDC000521]|uniref:hypothetical protein n=1 Tax=Dactylosporangium sp. NPDC000521 TaxID=3363975 RepID=UPI0036C27FE7